MWQSEFERIIVRGEEPLPLPPLPPGPDRDDERDLFDGEDGYEGGSMDDDEREPGGAE